MSRRKILNFKTMKKIEIVQIEKVNGGLDALACGISTAMLMSSCTGSEAWLHWLVASWGYCGIE